MRLQSCGSFDSALRQVVNCADKLLFRGAESQVGEVVVKGTINQDIYKLIFSPSDWVPAIFCAENLLFNIISARP